MNRKQPKTSKRARKPATPLVGQCEHCGKDIYEHEARVTTKKGEVRHPEHTPEALRAADE